MRRVTEPYRPDRAAVPELAAGAILVSEHRDELLLLHEKSEDRWCFPKGHVEAGESLVEGAVREITEETGIKEFTLLGELGEVNYRFFDPQKDRNVFKTTVYFLAFTPDRRAHPEALFDDYKWLRPPAAREIVVYDTDRQMIDKAQGQLSLRVAPNAHYG